MKRKHLAKNDDDEYTDNVNPRFLKQHLILSSDNCSYDTDKRICVVMQYGPLPYKGYPRSLCKLKC